MRRGNFKVRIFIFIAIAAFAYLRKCSQEEVNKLIKAGADVNAKSNAKMPIHYAITYNCLEIIKALRSAKKRYRTIFNAI